MFKFGTHKTFCENVTKLIKSVDLEEFDLAGAVGAELLTEPVITESIVLGARSHAGRFKLGKGQGAGVVSVDAGMDVGRVQREETKGSCDLLKDVDDREEVFA